MIQWDILGKNVGAHPQNVVMNLHYFVVQSES